MKDVTKLVQCEDSFQHGFHSNLTKDVIFCLFRVLYLELKSVLREVTSFDSSLELCCSFVGESVSQILILPP